jgi:hypothetical protein
MICPATKRPGGNEPGFSSASAGMSAFLKRTGAVLLVAGVVSTGALALDSSPTSEFEQKLKAYDPESIAAARQYARAADMKGMMARVAPTLRQQIIAGARAQNPNLSSAQIETFADAFVKSAFVDNAQAIEDASILMMMDIFDKDELIALGKFYSSPIGASIMSKMPKMMERMPTLLSSIVPRAIKDAQEKMKKNGLDVKI